jgi:cobalt/nickel transport protein
MKKWTIILLIAVVALAVLPLLVAGGGEFGGADGEAETAITEIDPGYTPWFSSIWEPPSGEIESLLFALQAAIGAGLVFYVLGYYIGRAKGREQAGKQLDAPRQATAVRPPARSSDAQARTSTGAS